MSIRYYLLLLAGLITTIVSLGSFFIGNIILHRSLQEARKDGVTLFNAVYEEKRDNLEQFTATIIAENLSRVNATLEAVSKFGPLTDWFTPSEENKKKGTWNNAASLVQQDEWINFLQNTAESKLLSLIVPEKGPFFEVRTVPISEGLAWVYILGSPSYENPFLGIEVPVRTVSDAEGDTQSFMTSGLLPKVYIAYEPGRFKTLTFSHSQEGGTLFEQTPFAGEIELDESRFLTYLSKAGAFIRNPSSRLPLSVSEKFPFREKKTGKKTFEEKLAVDFQQKVSYVNELFLIWQASILREMGIFGKENGMKNWPEAMTFSSKSDENGLAFFIASVMNFSSPVFDDVSFFRANPPKHPGDFVSSGSLVVKSPHENQAFLVNSAKLSIEQGGKKEESLLTLGFDLAPVLQNLVSSERQYGCMFAGGEVVLSLAPEGKSPIDSDLLKTSFIPALNGKSGIVEIAGVSYYFFKLKPGPDIDLDLFLFDPRKEEFSFVFDFQDKISAILQKVEIDRKMLEFLTIVVLWILLLDVSKKITGPILALSSALKHVNKGNWDRIQIPKIAFKRKNEIKQLFDSFEEMVEGMKEKEKIAGILNKVVSEEIAKEILKGDIKLGGEERIVTMLFADIRGFTKLTQNMPPHEVIGFLNKCMTKLSSAVEENKGVIDKYMGDGLMALYGAPITYPESSLHAVISALEMVSTLNVWNMERIKDKLPPIHVGIGIHTGPVFAGNMGAQNRLNYTVIGSNVNLASRLCSAAGPEEILITEDTYLHHPSIKDNVEVESKGPISLKGFDGQKNIFKVIRLKNKDAGKLLMKEEEKGD